MHHVALLVALVVLDDVGVVQAVQHLHLILGLQHSFAFDNCSMQWQLMTWKRDSCHWLSRLDVLNVYRKVHAGTQSIRVSSQSKTQLVRGHFSRSDPASMLCASETMIKVASAQMKSLPHVMSCSK